MSRHPWYIDLPNNGTYAEELITFLMLHLYYYVSGAAVSLGAKGVSEITKGESIKLTVHTTNETAMSVDKYKVISGYLSATNNFTVDDKHSSVSFTYPESENESIENDFNVHLQKIEYIDSSHMTGTCYYDSPDNAEINNEMNTFIPNIKMSYNVSKGINIYYDSRDSGGIRDSEQDAFGGNTGGVATKFKC